MNDRETIPSGNVPDAFDRQLAALHDLPDVVRVAPSTVRVVPPLGIGGTQLFVIQTMRQRERGDYIFIELGATRLVLPPVVARILARQRDALTDKMRSKSAKAVAAERKAQGIEPGFMKARRKGRRKAAEGA